MEAFLNSLLLVFVSEMGDKTQLLSIVLMARYRKPWTILSAVLLATIANHTLAAWSGVKVAQLVAPETLQWVLAVTFFIFAGWLLIPDKEGEITNTSHFGVFFTTLISFFIAEMGDKTQLATIALGAKYADAWLVTIGSTAGMMGSNALAVFLGEPLLNRVPMTWIRRIAAALFVIFGLGILLGRF